MLFLAEPLTRFAKKHPKLVCKPGLREKVGQAERCHRRNWTCIHFLIFILSVSERVDVRTWLRIQETRGTLQWGEKKWALLACRQRRLKMFPNVYGLPSPAVQMMHFPPAKPTPGTPHLCLLCTPTTLEGEKTLNFPYAMLHLTEMDSLAKEQPLAWRYNRSPEGAVGRGPALELPECPFSHRSTLLSTGRSSIELGLVFIFCLTNQPSNPSLIFILFQLNL